MNGRGRGGGLRCSQGYEWDKAGHARLYEKLGFAKAGERDGRLVMRKQREEQKARKGL